MVNLLCFSGAELAALFVADRAQTDNPFRSSAFRRSGLCWPLVYGADWTRGQSQNLAYVSPHPLEPDQGGSTTNAK